MSRQVSPSLIPLSLHDTYLSDLLSRVIKSTAPSWCQKLREDAVNCLENCTIPTTREEEWRFTDLSNLRQRQFQPVETLETTSLAEFVLPEAVKSRLVFVNGIYSPRLSDTTSVPDGVVIGNIAGLSASDIQRVQQYLEQSAGTPEIFTYLNTAGLNDLALVWVEQNVLVESPIHLLFVSVVGEKMTISQPRCLVVAETGSQVSLIEEYTHPDHPQTAYFTNSVTEIWLGENAQVTHTRVAREGEEAFHIGKTTVTQSRYSRYLGQAIALGGKLSRHNLEILQTGEQTETNLNSLTVVTGNQLGDIHSTIALNHPRGVSRQLHKCIVGDRAHGIFNGKIFVPKLAQLTDAVQLNRNLLLSPKARVDTKPQLEITADNVKCAHGATVSQLEDDDLFYLQSRGIRESDARKLLVNAFATEIIHQIPLRSLRDDLLNQVISLIQAQ